MSSARGKAVLRGFAGRKIFGTTGCSRPPAFGVPSAVQCSCFAFSWTPAVLASSCATLQAASTFPAASAAVVFFGAACKHRTPSQDKAGRLTSADATRSRLKTGGASITKHQDADPPPYIRASSSAPAVSPLHVFPLRMQASAPLRCTPVWLAEGATHLYAAFRSQRAIAHSGFRP